MAWLSGWNYRKKITIQYANIDSDLTWFPLYVDITADGDIGTNISDSTNGYDIRFTQSDGETLLKYEREYFNVTTGVATGHFWVSADGWVIANDAGTDLYIYYNDGDGTVDGEDATAVWDTNFTRVYHLKGSYIGTANEVIDSAGTTHAQGGGGTDTKCPTQADVKIYKGQDFDGADDYIHCGLAQPISNSETRSMWIRWDDVSTEDAKFIGQNYMSADCGGDGTNLRGRLHDGAWRDVVWATSNLSDDVLYYVTITWDAVGGTVKLYVNADLKDTNSNYDGTPGSASQDLAIGSTRLGSTPATDGKIDEVRFSNIDRGVDWIKFEYNNMNEADSELDWASEESALVVGGGGFFMTLDMKL